MNPNKPVYVYRCLSNRCRTNTAFTEPLYSVMQGGLVVMHTHRILLQNVTFVVRPAGQAKVRQEKRKNVHAFVKGYVVDNQGVFGIDQNGKDLPAKIKYNPYTMDTFTWEGRPVHKARAALINEHGVSACYLD